MTSVSVIIPTWNRSASLERAVRSALGQSHPPLEVLVCDDGSTDDSEFVVRSIGDPRVIWLTGARSGGPAVPRNRGIGQSRGDWLAFLDDDDEWLPGKLAAQLALCGRLECLASSTQALRIAAGEPAAPYQLGWSADRLAYADLLRSNFVICSSALIHRSLIGELVGFPESPKLQAIEDYAFWLRVATLTDFAFVDSPLVRYSDLPVNSIRKLWSDPWKQKQAVLENFFLWALRSGNSRRRIKAALRAYRETLWILAKPRLSRLLGGNG